MPKQGLPRSLLGAELSLPQQPLQALDVCSMMSQMTHCRYVKEGSPESLCGAELSLPWQPLQTVISFT
jgi:hypothetical protein